MRRCCAAWGQDAVRGPHLRPQLVRAGARRRGPLTRTRTRSRAHAPPRRITVPGLRLSMCVQRLIDLERASAAAQVAAAREEVRAEFAAAAGAAAAGGVGAA